MSCQEVELLKKIAFNAFTNPNMRYKFAQRAISDSGFVTSSSEKVQYSISAKKQDNGDLVISSSEFGNTHITIKKEEQLQYIAYIKFLFENNRCLIEHAAIQARKTPEKNKSLGFYDIFNAKLFNSLTGKNEYADNITLSENLLASTVEIANNALSSIARTEKVTKDGYLKDNIKIIDDFFNSFDIAEKKVSSSNKSRFHDIIKRAYSECNYHGDVNYRFGCDNQLPINDLSNKLRKMRKQKTDDLLLADCLAAIRKTVCNEDLFLLVGEYLTGNEDQARKKAEILKTKLKEPSSSEKTESKILKKHIIENVLKNLYLGTALNDIYRSLSSCIHRSPDGFYYRDIKLENMSDIQPVNPLQESDALTEKSLKQINDANKKAAEYEPQRHTTPCNLDNLNRDVACGRIAQANTRSLNTFANAWLRNRKKKDAK